MIIVKAMVVEKPGIILVKEVPEPKLENEYEILVKVNKTSICRHPTMNCGRAYVHL